ncbi:hypothetical protein AALO_G00251890 [Alosa alosa]|uniref:CTCK domain-containing protein n=1 Tax=Alosa alosa TaxID=278164 RepID=A0AAV6FN05_9TELE|nr:sclerostin domain-containing protein 1b [Alosa alosa]KAG5264273.1 hypothetical protein AALO_G00251890 [Alosa alosa]
MSSPACGYQLGLLLCILLKNCNAVKNGDTEMLNGHILPPVHETPTNVSLNRARNGGRSLDTSAKLDQTQVGCRELRSTKYISDGQCTSLTAVKELVCAGECLPNHLLPNWIGASLSGRYWSRRDTQEWRCVTDRTRTQRIQLQCVDGSSRTYKIQAVTSCKCKRYSRQHNDSVHQTDTSSQAQAAPDGPKKRRNKNKKQNQKQGKSTRRPIQDKAHAQH